MIQLQHYGAATRLLDVTTNPFVALFFACDMKDCDGAVYSYAADTRCHALPEQTPSWDTIVSSAYAGKPVLFTPSRINERIKAQSGMFFVTSLKCRLSDGSAYTNDTNLMSITKVVIPAKLKPQLRSYVQESLGIDSLTLFPDFQGYAIANSATARFTRNYCNLYDPHDSYGVFPTPFSLEKVPLVRR